jgi:hypothetical protein
MCPRRDDPNIADEVVLWRVMREATWIKETPDGVRQSSHCFKDNTIEEGADRSEHETSVFVVNEGESPLALLDNIEPNIGYLCAITAADARAEGFMVYPDPDGDIQNARHFVVTPTNRDITTARYNKACVKLAGRGTLNSRRELEREAR